MYLQTDNYMFPITINGDIYELANCIMIEVYENVAYVQDLLYRTTCSLDKKLQRGTGTIEMLQGFIKLVLKKRKGVTNVKFTDSSTVVIDGKEILLADWKWHTTGQTWYEKHMGAIPSFDTNVVLRGHKKLKKKGLVPLEYTREGVDSWLKPFRLRPLSCETWEISRETVMAYPVSVKSVKSKKESIGGTQSHIALTKEREPVLYRWWFGYKY